MKRFSTWVLGASLLAFSLPACSDSNAGDEDVSFNAAESELSDPPEFSEGIPIPRFLEVSPGIYRGGEPGENGIAYLKSIGVRTIIDLRYAGWPDESQEELDDEATLAEAAGIEHHAFGFSAYRSIPDGQVVRALSALRSPDKFPIFIHCKRGRDRTGLVVAIHRILDEGWSHDAAYQEMLQLGFRKRYFQMLRYFDRKTAGYP